MLTDAAERRNLANDFIIDSESITIRFKRIEDGKKHDEGCSVNSISI